MKIESNHELLMVVEPWLVLLKANKFVGVYEYIFALLTDLPVDLEQSEIPMTWRNFIRTDIQYFSVYLSTHFEW